MRIAINSWFWNEPTTGSGQYTRRLVERLAATAPDLEIVLVAPEGQITNFQSSITNHQFSISDFHFQSSSRYRLPAALDKVRFEQIIFPRACRCLEADVAHAPYWAPPLQPSVPTVVTIHDLIPLLLREYRGGPLVRLYTALVSQAAHGAALVITDSEASRRDIVAHLGLPVERVHVVYLAADKKYAPAPAPDDKAIRARYGLPERYALYLGGFDARKNIATVLGIYRWAEPAIGDECPLVIAGRLPERDTEFAPDPRRLAQEQEIDKDCVHFTGFVNEVHKPALYRGAAAFIFPSRYEGFGLPPLEALACGTPVVGSDVSSLPEVVGDAGVLLPPDDVEGMAGALIQLATDESFRTELSHRALAQAARFSWERAARETLAVYRDAVTGAI
ncbi:MAG TPA: glycosyltransferase family 4 protein [Thermoflexia bacterium]|nr:glycosyltransferase family 4 protein [Thermoflexia bacterium]